MAAQDISGFSASISRCNASRNEARGGGGGALSLVARISNTTQHK
jgi:hypothetical protein